MLVARHQKGGVLASEFLACVGFGDVCCARTVCVRLFELSF